MASKACPGGKIPLGNEMLRFPVRTIQCDFLYRCTLHQSCRLLAQKNNSVAKKNRRTLATPIIKSNFYDIVNFLCSPDESKYKRAGESIRRGKKKASANYLQMVFCSFLQEGRFRWTGDFPDKRDRRQAFLTYPLGEKAYV